MKPDTGLAQPPLGLYAVAAFDILGQSERLMRATWPLRPGQDQQDAMRSFVDAAHGVHLVREVFAASYGIYRAPIGQDPNMTQEQRARQIQFFSAEVRFLTFSDTVLAYVNLREDPTLVQGVLAILSTCASVFLALLSAEIPTRGAIDVGLAYRLSDLSLQGNPGTGDDPIDVGYAYRVSDDEIYGPVLASVHRLESRVAQWPRVVLGDGLAQYLHSLAEPPGGAPPDARILKALEVYLDLIQKDVDGWPILDYLGRWTQYVGLRHRDPKNPTYAERDAYRFVKKQAERFRDERNEKLAVRYNLTLEYLRSRAHLWPGMTDVGT
jgi:hypothetical protein